MKKFLIPILFLLLICAESFSAPVSETEALKIARNFFSMNKQISSSSSIKLIFKSETFENKNQNQIQSQNDVYYYVFGKDKNGFVIISADDCVSPLLGYSFENVFEPENLPSNISNWLNYYKEQIKLVKKNQIAAPKDIINEWKSLSLKKVINRKIQNSVQPLIETQWNQSPFVNDLCPFDTTAKKRAITGCVATAMAQVLKYWGYPKTGSGIHSYNHATYGTLTANFGATTYEWSQMPLKVNAPNLAVATLMYHCGVGVEMMYGPNASGAYPSKIPIAFRNFFSYDSTVKLIEKNSYKEPEWIEILVDELNHKRPICYTGYGSGGHEFVCDGYNEDGLFHFNWGWGGYCDGYFRINELNPGGSSFSTFQMALVGLKPPSEMIDPNLEIYEDVKAVVSKVYFGNPFTITTNVINNSDIKFFGDITATIFDKDNNLVDFVEILKNQDTLLKDQFYTKGLKFNYKGSMRLVPGKYKIFINYRKKDGDWKQIRRNPNDQKTADFCEIEIYNNNAVTLYSEIITNPFKVLGQGNELNINFHVANYGATAFTGFLGAALFDVDGNFIVMLDQMEEKDGLQPYDFNYNKLEFIGKNIDIPPGDYFVTGVYKSYTDQNYSIIGSKDGFVNPVQIRIVAKPKEGDAYEPNNFLSIASRLKLDFINDKAEYDLKTPNIHKDDDVDIYRIDLEHEYDYLFDAELEDILNSETKFTLDAKLYYSLDSLTWVENSENTISPALWLNGKHTVFIKIVSFTKGNVGTYNLKLRITRQTWAPIISLSNNISFDKVVVGFNSKKSFTIRNIGKYRMLFDSISCPDGYSVDLQNGSLDSGETRTVNITFAPTTDKIYSGRILIHANTDFGTNYLQVYGTGISNATSPIILMNGNMNYGKVGLGEKKSTMLTIQNIGNAPLYVYEINYPDDFSDEWYNGIIPANDKIEIEITFAPKSVKKYSGFIEVDCNSVSGNRKIEISGEGYDPNSIGDKFELTDILIYPNPSSNNLNITLKDNNQQICELQIYDRTGKIILFRPAINKQSFELNIETLSSGTYYCKIIALDKKEYLTKFEIIR